MKARNKERIKTEIYLIILVLYILGFVLVFNYRQLLGIGYYHNEKNFTTTFSEGTGGINLKIHALHITYNEHDYDMEITTFSTPDSYLEGITYLDYIISTSVIKKVLTMNYSIPIISYSIGITPKLQTNLYQNDNLTCKGFADMIFKVDDINEIKRISFDIGIIITFDGTALNYEWGIASIWVNVIYLSCATIPLTFLYRSIKKQKFLKWYSEDLRKRDELFNKKLGEINNNLESSD